ncbi:MAG: ATP-binding protein [bacterium]
MQFTELYGQAAEKEKLVNLVSNNRLSHALLFLGKEGSGSLELAIALAQYIVCEKNKPGGSSGADSLFGGDVVMEYQRDSCGNCASCKKASALIHPDIHFSFPTINRNSGDKTVANDFITEWRSFIKQTPFGNAYDWLESIGAENKQGNITVYECEDILRKINLKSFESGYKILIQWMPEYLGKEGNKLLKLIEEPPPNTLFIFVAEDESKILSTILSRTQLVKINRLESKDIQEWLITKQAVPREKAIRIASMSNGNMREAFQLLHHADENWQDLLREWLNAILKNGPPSQMKWVDEVSKLGREKQKQFLTYFIHLLSISVHLSNQGTAPDIDEKELDFANRLLRLAATEQLEAIVNELDRSIYYIERNANAKMLFMALTIKIYHIIRDKTVILSN